MKKKKANKPKAVLPKTTHAPKIQDVRSIVIQRMDKMGLKAYGLAKLTGLTEQAIRAYVRGKSDMRGERLSLLLAVLGLEIRPKP